MADFCITKVNYAADRSHIQLVHVREETHENGKILIGAPRVVARAFIADLIRLGKATFQTRMWNEEKKVWSVGAAVHLIDESYITTDKNSRKRDNLENLPEF